jgi:hypothetical protein
MFDFITGSVLDMVENMLLDADARPNSITFWRKSQRILWEARKSLTENDLNTYSEPPPSKPTPPVLFTGRDDTVNQYLVSEPFWNQSIRAETALTPAHSRDEISAIPSWNESIRAESAPTPASPGHKISANPVSGLRPTLPGQPSPRTEISAMSMKREPPAAYLSVSQALQWKEDKKNGKRTELPGAWLLSRLEQRTHVRSFYLYILSRSHAK